MKLFNLRINHIIEYMDKMLQKNTEILNGKLKYICLVGGFSKSTYLQYMLKQHYGSTYKFVIPQKSNSFFNYLWNANEKDQTYHIICEEKKIKIIIQYLIRILQINFGWVDDFDKLVVNYIMFYFILIFFLIQIKINISILNRQLCTLDLMHFVRRQINQCIYWTY
ncbi:hypothetical protein RFI_20541 [Reticulomyxa filosa]|uniref:Uncharacterized protein n=1 Tax=Reticulomyxa filosa TaxID=46433 RepID=X6MTL4_RETFI|nr:hypothetical protein RFI_20541 [Reticulomyxa filosa]|eukprot:ETO16797.1 hypothetical protein RFI_20541 [Reticulomyxa filosa]